METMIITEAYLGNLYRFHEKKISKPLYSEIVFPASFVAPTPENPCPEKLAYTLYDLQEIFDCKYEKALKIMHLMYKYDCATQLGKKWYTTRDKVEQIINMNMGQSIEI